MSTTRAGGRSKPGLPDDYWRKAYEMRGVEIDRLRVELAWTEQLAQDRGEENERMRPVVAAAIAWADAEDEALTTDLQDSTDALWEAVETFRAPCHSDCHIDSTGLVHATDVLQVGAMNGRPTLDEIDVALDVLLWLHENTDDGHARDDVSRVRYMLDNPTWEDDRP